MRVLFLTPRFPWPPLKGDSLRAYHQLRVLSGSHRITLVSLTDEPVDAAARERVADLCERVEVVRLSKVRAAANVLSGFVSRRPLQVLYYRSPQFERRMRATLACGSFDLVHVTLLRMLPYVWGLDDPPAVVDLVDSQTLNLAERRRQVRGRERFAYELEYRRVRDYERAAVDRFPALVVSSDADRRQLIESRADRSSSITVLPNGVDFDRFPFRGAEERDRDTLVFTGNMGYHPNEEAVLWFANAVWPSLRRGRPGLRFRIVGADPTRRVRALRAGGTGIEVSGPVPDLARELASATVAVCPMRSGSGIQNKVLEAMAAGTPVVATPIGNRGVQAVPDRDLVVAGDPREFAAAVARLLDEPDTRDRLARSGRAFVERNHRWEDHGAKLSEVYSRVSADLLRRG